MSVLSHQSITLIAHLKPTHLPRPTQCHNWSAENGPAMQLLSQNRGILKEYLLDMKILSIGTEGVYSKHNWGIREV